MSSRSKQLAYLYIYRGSDELFAARHARDHRQNGRDDQHVIQTLANVVGI